MAMAKGSLLNKQNRLDRLVGLLRQDEIWTMKRLADQLEVSDRTLLRDINELRDQGVPIEAERGPGGGVSLSRRWGVDKLRLNHEEVISMLVSLAITETLQSPLLAEPVRSVRQKLTLGLPEHQRQVVNQLRKRILVGDAASAQVTQTYSPPSAGITKGVTTGFFNMEMLDIEYIAGSGDVTKRRIEPQYLFFNWPVWYLLGWDHLREAPRVFRIDRMQRVTISGETFRPRAKSLILQGLEDYYRLL
jgi:predicted DNA-binding transcriptional regulator YafY